MPATEPKFSATQSRTPSDEPQFIVPTTKIEPATLRSEPAVPIRVRSPARETSTFTVRDGLDPNEARRHTLRDSGQGLPSADRHTVGEPGVLRDTDTYSDEVAGMYVEPRHGREGGPEFIHDDERSGLGFGGVFWSVLVLLGVAAALLQAAYIYRVQLASEFPNLRPALEYYCETLGCTVDYPRRISQIAIMDSSLQAVRDSENANEDASHLTLNVVLRNNYEKPQQWPTLSVELVDFSGTVAVRRLLAPSDYLPELSQERPFPARSEVRVSVPLTVSGVQVNGYQLDRFFP